MNVRLSSKLPEPSRCGLDMLAGDYSPALVVAVVAPKTIERDLDDGSETMTLRVVSIEPILSGDAAARARELLEDARARRTGQGRVLSLIEDDGA